MPTLYLQCNMDRLGPAYETDKPYYLLTLSVAFATKPATADEVRQMLRPWAWPAIKALSVFRQDAAGGAFSEVKHRLLPASEITELRMMTGALDNELEQQLKEFDDTAGDFAWNPLSPNPATWTGRINRDWRSWIGHIGSYPGGVGSALNLAFVFVPETAPKPSDIVLAAPHFSLNGVDFRPGDPATNLKEVVGLPVAYQWSYDQDAVAFVNKPEPPEPDLATYINIETQWRNELPLDGGGNWLEQLDDRLAQAFDGPELLLGWVRKAVDNKKPIPAELNDVLIAAFFRVVSPVIDSRFRPFQGDGISQLPAKVDDKLPPIPSGAVMPADFASLLEKAIKAGANAKLTTFPPGVSDPKTFRDDWSVVQGAFRQNGVLIVIILELWKRFFGAMWSDDLQKALTGKLGELTQLHQYLLAHSAGDTWRSMTPDGVKAGEEFSQASIRVTEDLKVFGRLTWANGDADWDELIKAQAKSVTLEPKDIPTDPTSDGLLIQVDKIEASATDPEREKKDYLRRLTGVGILLKKKDGPWRCLNMADVQVYDLATQKHEPIDKTPRALPYRYTYTAGLRQGFIKYVNQPLVAVSPWSQLSPSRELKPEGNGENGAENGLLRFESVYRSTGDWQLERLVYGEEYLVAPFYFGNAGVLPELLSATDGAGGKVPWNFKLPADSAVLPGTTAIACLRSCPVGLLRIVEAGTFPPELPEHVYPIASVIERDPENRHPLIVLLPSDTKGWNEKVASKVVSLSLRPPSLDVKVWDRWIPDDAMGNNRERRRKVLGQVHDLRYQLDTGLIKSADTTVDDPAVSGFKVKAERLWPTPQQFSATLAPEFKPKPGNGLDAEQKESIRVRITSASISDPTFTLNAQTGEYLLSVPDGEVWQVKLQPTIPNEAAKRFDKDVIDQAEPLTFVVEVAQPFPKNAEAPAKLLYQGLRLEPSTEKLLLQLEPKDFNQFAPLVHRVELVTQRWRWDGRPVYELPLADPPQSGLPFTKLGELDAFDGDGLLFSSREDTDASIHPTQVEFACDHAKRTTLREIDWIGRAGVLYYRFAVRAFSRYEGLLENPLPVDSSGVLGKAEPRRWKRYVRESQWNRRVPKPSVKLLLPLTQSVSTVAGTKGTTGWLVVLDEPWYGEAMAGLGESLVSEIVSVRLPDALDETRPQGGPDPIIEVPEDPYGEYRVALPKPVGAIGSTFDTITEAPLFARSVFFQPPPILLKDGEAQNVDLTFHFFKLRFQRVIVGVDPKQPREQVLNSEFTDGQWTQILPPSEWWYVEEAKDRVHVSNITFAQNVGFMWNGKLATILPTGPRPQPPESVCRFQLFGLVTQEVTDAFGRQDQERFDGLWSLEKLKTLNLVTRARLRLVEIQFRSKAGEALPIKDTDPSLNELAEALFPNGDNPEDAKGRMVRASPPVTVA